MEKMNFLHVNMTTGHTERKTVPDDFAELGGRALSSHLICQILAGDDSAGGKEKTDPLGPENPLIFAPGLLSGTPFVNTGRLSIGAKSPLTGGIKESNVGGITASALARQGIKAVIVEGKAPAGALYHLVIDADGNASLTDAASTSGLGTYETTRQLFSEFGERNAVAVIGPAGEQQLRSASVQVTDPDGAPCRSAARGGLGAVMGSKGLKSVIVSRQAAKRVSVSSLGEEFKQANARFAKALKRDGWSGRVLPRFGTASILANTNMGGALPTLNARQGSFDGADRISGEVMADTIERRGGKTTHKGCSGCVIHCSNQYVDADGAPLTSALEYETLWAMGAMTGIDDLDAIAKLDYLCDDLGLDTMNTGTALAVAMDAGLLSFGDAEAAIRLVASIAENNETGLLVGHGPDAIGRHLGHSRIPTIKGQSIAGYDPRAMPGMGVTYATSPMGGDHTAGFVGGVTGDVDMLRNVSLNSQIHMAAVDSAGLCMFAQSGGMENLFVAVSAVTGTPFGQPQWRALGERCLKAERDFNRRAGLTEADDRLPAMFHSEPLDEDTGTVPYPEHDLHGTLAGLG